MKGPVFVALLLLPPYALGQAVRQCQSSDGTTNCTTQPVQVNPNAFSDAFENAQRLQQEKRVNDAGIEASRQQTETARLQNELLRQQLEQAQAGRVASEVALLKAEWDKLTEQENKQPAKDRFPPLLLSAMAISNVTKATGNRPLDRSVEAFRRQIGIQ